MNPGDPTFPQHEETERFLDPSEALPFLAGDGWRARLRIITENLLGITRTREIFHAAARGEDSADALLAGFNLPLDADGVVESIPASGPVIVVANHPFGGADALALIALCLRARSDFRILANHAAATAPIIRRWSLPLSILGGRDTARKNAGSLRSALDHLRSGGLLAVFPAGEVSTWRPELGRIADKPWTPHVASLARKSQASVLPVRFFGANPPWFHLAGALHPLFRTALILPILLASGGRPVTCRAGALVSPDELAASDDPTATLRRLVDGLTD